MDKPAPDFLWTLFTQLRRRGFPLGPDDYGALRQALKMGFGWSSREELRDLCCALWAKSRPEKEILEALFDQLDVSTWELPQLEASPSPVEGAEPEEQLEGVRETKPATEEPSREPETSPQTQPQGGLPPISLTGVELPEYPMVLVQQSPVSYREVAQAWRRLRHPVREGPPVELDIEATVDHRCRSGIVSEVVLLPRRRNIVRLLLLVDRQGSMTPFHQFAHEVCAAIQDAGELGYAALYYFHDVPAEGADDRVLHALSDELFPSLDGVMPEINPLVDGFLYRDPELLSPQPLSEVLETYADRTAVVLLSDGGAARGRRDLLRLLDTVAFLKALRGYTPRFVWLNPLPRDCWADSTAAEIARHVPMFPLDRMGMYRAVNVLRGQPYFVERAV